MEFRNKTQIGNKVFAWAKVKDLRISKYNVRPEVSEEEREEIKETLGKSIKEIGLQQIPVCTSEGEVYIGGRRLIAHDEIGEEWMLVEIRDASPFEQMLASYTENFHRKSPDYWNEGKLFSQMIKLGKVSQRELAKKLGLSRPYVEDRIQIWERLSGRRASMSGLDFKQVRLLTRDTDIPEGKLDTLIEDLKSGELSTRELEKILAETKIAKKWLSEASEKVRKSLEPIYEPLLYTKALDLDRLNRDISKAEGNPLPLKKMKIAFSYFGSDEKAEQFAKMCDGRYLGKVTETWALMEIDPYKYEEEMTKLKEKDKEKEG